MNLANLAINNGGRIAQLILPSEVTKGMGTMNPSIFLDGDRILVNIRVLNYILYHNESQKYQHVWGPLQYIHPDDDKTLRTYNFIAELDEDLCIKWFQPVDTSMLDVNPIWEFIGLEDARLLKVDDKFYMTGVRRDTTTNGTGRMELSEITITPEKVKEVNRKRIPAPGLDNTYCEKNWMPVLGAEPFTYIKWCTPTEVVQYKDGKTTTIALNYHPFSFQADLRGGSQVVPFQGGYLAITHEVYLHRSDLGAKNATYRHRFVRFSKDLRITETSKEFSFMDADIEFCCGLAVKDNKVLITYGFQDNSAFILEMHKDTVNDFISD
jgi:hypothetical protein